MDSWALEPIALIKYLPLKEHAAVKVTETCFRDK